MTYQLLPSLKDSCLYLPLSAPLVEVDKETDEQNYLLWRIERGVAEGSAEIPKGVYLFPCINLRILLMRSVSQLP